MQQGMLDKSFWCLSQPIYILLRGVSQKLRGGTDHDKWIFASVWFKKTIAAEKELLQIMDANNWLFVQQN